MVLLVSLHLLCVCTDFAMYQLPFNAVKAVSHTQTKESLICLRGRMSTIERGIDFWHITVV